MLRTLVLIVALQTACFACTMPATAFTAAARHAKGSAHAVHVIVIDKMQFGSMPTDIRAGDIIEWNNHDIFEHSVTARDGKFDLDLKPGATVRMTATAGAAAFFCKFHPNMTGTLIVR